MSDSEKWDISANSRDIRRDISRARTGLKPQGHNVPCPVVVGHSRPVTGHAGFKAVTSHPVGKPSESTITVEPWPDYDEQGRAWWSVRVDDARTPLRWCSTEGRWAKSEAVWRLRRGKPQAFAEAERVVRSAVGPAVAVVRSAATWLHVAAASLIAEHKAGKDVSPGKLAMAERVMASLAKGVAPARAFSDARKARA